MKLFGIKLFDRTGGYWLFWTCAIYMVVGGINTFVYHFTEIEYIEAIWITVMALPLFIKPLAHYLNMLTLWEE